MTRNLIYNALILRSRPSGESNREIWLLTEESGLLRATVFGGPKSKLRAYASPFHSGQAFVYQDPAKDARKLSDFDVRSWRPGLRELYERAMAADAIAETILATHGGGAPGDGGHWNESLSLAEKALDALETADGGTCLRILLHFLWQWIGFLGLKPDFSHCTVCGKTAPANTMLWYSVPEGGVVCDNCRNGNEQETGPGCRRWLETVRTLPSEQLVRYTLDGKSFHEAQSLVTAILTEALGRKLASWEMV